MRPKHAPWRIVGFSTLVAALAVVGVLALVVAGRRVTAERVRAARTPADGLSLDVRALAPPRIPEERNAALLLSGLVEEHRARRSVLGHAARWEPALEGASEELAAAARSAEARGEAPGSAAMEAEMDLRVGGTPTEEGLVLLRAYLRDAEAELALVASAARRRSWRFELPVYTGQGGGPWVPHAFLILATSSALTARALLQLHDGEATETVESLRQSLFVARSTADEPTLVSAMTQAAALRSALESLNQALPELPAGIDLTALERELDAFDLRRSLRRAFAGERAFVHRLMRHLATGGPHAAGSGALVLPSMRRVLLRLPLVADLHECEALDHWTKAIALLDRPYLEIEGMAAELDERVSDPPWQASLLRLGPPIAGHLKSVAQVEAQLVLARLALLARRADKEAAEAAADATLDPLSGVPVRHLREADGALRLACDADPHADGRAAIPCLSWRVP